MEAMADETRDNVFASRTRQRVLALVAESEDPLDAAQIASDIEIHLTTVRFHLKQLEDAGLVRRQIQKEPRRGRPRVVYRAGPVVRNDTSRQHHIDVLAGALAREDDGSARSIQAGRMWADELDDMSTALTS
jgi:predicted ArsR family transcriptional regulator